MPGTNTGSGKSFENEVRNLLSTHGFKISNPKAALGTDLAGRAYKRAFIAESSDGTLLLVTTYFQDTSGTVQEKVPWDVLTLGKILNKSNGRFARAYLVVGGVRGFTLRPYFTSGELQASLVGCECVIIVDQDELRRLASTGKL